jgi:uncharacterized membrane protein
MRHDMTRWLQRHADTIGILIVVGGAMLAGIGLGALFIVAMNIWRVL